MINVALENLEEFWHAFEDELQEAVQQTLQYVQEEWADSVKNGYLAQAIMNPDNISMDGPLSGQVALVDPVALKLLIDEEHGAPAWDMKPALLKGRSHIKIPFRGSTERYDPQNIRTLSMNSPSGSWWYPEKTANPHIEAVSQSGQDYLESLVEEILEEMT